MPTIARFYGISIQMFWNDHNPPHFHARYGNARAAFRIDTREILFGELPPTATRLIETWALARKAELEQNWERARAQQELERIPGPDAE